MLNTIVGLSIRCVCVCARLDYKEFEIDASFLQSTWNIKIIE